MSPSISADVSSVQTTFVSAKLLAHFFKIFYDVYCTVNFLGYWVTTSAGSVRVLNAGRCT